MGELVGREREIARLRSRLDGAAAGTGGLTLIRGEAGIGKTALARWTASTAADLGFQVLIGRAHPHGTMISYGPIVEALGRSLRELDDAAVAELTNRIVGLSVLLPGLVEEPDLPSLPDNLALTRTLEAIRGIVVRLASKRPLLLVIDDVQWADTATLRTLAHLAGEVDGAPMIVVLTMREGHDADRPDVRSAVAALRRVTAVDELTPTRLDATETARMLARLGGDDLSPEMIAEIVERSVGTPLFVEALGREALDRQRATTSDVVGDGAQVPPAAVADAIGERLHGLSDEAMAVLATVALAAADAELTLTRHVSGLDDDSFDAAVRELTARHLVVTAHPTHGTVLDVAHPVIAEVVDSRLSPLERRRLHLALLDAYGDAVDAETAAVHVVGAADHVAPDRAIAVLGGAIDQAMSRQAHRSVAAHAGRALDLTRILGWTDEQLRLSDLLVRALFGLGEFDAAEALTSEALALEPSDERLLLPILMRAEVLAWLRGGGSDEVERFERALDAIPTDDVGPDVLRALEHRMTLRARRDDPDGMQAAAADVDRRLAGRPEPGARAMNRLGRCYRFVIQGQSSKALEVIDEVLDIAREADISEQLHRARVAGLDARLVVGPVAAVRRAAAAVTGSTSTIFLSWRDPVVRYVCSLATLDAGWLRDDEIDRSPSTGRPMTFRSLVVDAHRAWLAGDVDLIGDPVGGLGDGRAEGASEAERACVRAAIALIRQDRVGALAALELLDGRRPHAAVELLMEELTAQLALFAGDVDALSRVLVVMRRQDGGDGWASAQAVKFDGLREGDDTLAAVRLLDAADRFATIGDRRQEAESLTAAAQRSPESVDRERLSSLLGPVTRARLDRLAARMREVLGEQPPADGGRVGALTARQLEIAGLVAEGLTNAAIADRLFISVRTVTSHLDHIYTRLGIGNRTELAVLLPDLRG